MPISSPPTCSLRNPLAAARLLEQAQAISITRQIETATLLHPNHGFKAEHLDGAVVALTKPHFGWKLDHIAGFALNGPASPQTLDRIEDLFRARPGIVPHIDVSPAVDRGTRNLLKERGFGVSGHINVHVLELNYNEHTKPEPNPNPDPDPDAGSEQEISITQISPSNQHLKTTFVKTSVEAFTPNGRPPELLYTLAQTATLRPDTRLYLAYIGGKVAGSAGMAVIPTTSGGHAPIFCIASTLPEFCGRGVQTALLRARIAEVKRGGFEFAVVETRPGTGSARNVARIGFRLAYVKETFSKMG